VFEDPQILHRGMKISMPHPLAGSGKVDLIGNPIKYSETKIEYRMAPPYVGQHTQEVLKDILGVDEAEISRFQADGAI
jgi:crotonobetainyl-CoA:carnitine CoA-transferase CaiB-like acyl-CoA transferase